MAEKVSINHAFVSAKSESPDTSIASKDEWNADLIISGGQDGQPLLRDSTKSTGARWAQKIEGNINTGSYSGASPSGALCPVTVTVTDAALILGWFNIGCVTSSGASATLNFRINGSIGASYVIPGNGTNFCIFHFVNIASALTHVYDFTVSVGGGATFTSFIITAGFVTLPVL